MPDTRDVIDSAIAGLAGAAVVNVIHETTRQFTPDAPRMDVVGMRALARLSRSVGAEPPDRLRTATFFADIATNAVYYSLAALAGRERAVAAGAVLGAAAGLGGVLLPPPMHLGDEEVRRTPTTQALVVAMYLAGGLVAGAAFSALAAKRESATYTEPIPAWVP